VSLGSTGKGVNPSCDIHAYRGGLRCCKGGTVILDQDQNVTNNYVWEWQLKFRYYYEIVEDPTQVQNTFMTSWWTEHNNGEHDVPVCLESDKSKCQNTISSNFTVGMFRGCENGCQMITMEGGSPTFELHHWSQRCLAALSSSPKQPG
jgi:hypothetical protein